MNLTSSFRRRSHLARSLATIIVAVAGCMTVGGYAAERNWERPITAKSSAKERLTAFEWAFVEALDVNGRLLPELTKLTFFKRERAVVLRFSEQGAGGISVCTSIGWRYKIQGSGGIRFDRFFTELAGCGAAGVEGLAASEIEVLGVLVYQQLHLVRSFALTPSDGTTLAHLTLVFADQSRWNFSGTPTLATRLGVDKQRLLFEVAPERQACGDAVQDRQRECMRVREVRWNSPDPANPIRNAELKQVTLNMKEMVDRYFDWNSLEPFSHTGPWQLLDLDAIEGFKHKQGARTLEYVDKYRLKKQPPGAPDFAYVYGSRMVPHAAP